MELSALLTKKAALIGGGAAATTTAVTVPIVVTQSKNEESSDNKKAPTSRTRRETGEDDGTKAPEGDEDDYKPRDLKDNPLKDQVVLNIDDGDAELIDTLNKPGYCITKSFKNIQNQKNKQNVQSPNEHQKGLFKRPSTLNNTRPHNQNNIAHFDLSSGGGSDPKINEFDYSCFMFNRDQVKDSKDFSFELVIKKNNHGWFWKVVKKENRVLFREAAVHKPSGNSDGTWEGYSGVDGEFETEDDITPNFDDPIFKDLTWYKAKDCNAGEQCRESISGVFIKETQQGKTFLPSNENNNWSNAILTLGPNQNYQSENSDGKRKGYFGDGEWYQEKSTQPKLFTFNKETILGSIKGNWKDLVQYCQQTGVTGEPFTNLCPTTQQPA